MYRSVVLNLFSTTPPLSNCSLCQAPLTIKKWYKQMYLLVKFLIKLPMLQSALQSACAPLKSIDAPLLRTTGIGSYSMARPT